MTRTVLLVDVDHQRRRAVHDVLSADAHVDACADFASARARLLAHPPQSLATHHQLGAYNGLHLAHLVRGLQLPTRVVVYGDPGDTGLARETRTAGAFFVPCSQLDAALPAWLNARLPPEDRRDGSHPDRRHAVRGGRRATDAHA